ncbi:MAG TPA: BCCT transporter, partial [Citreicella sp.]|nr:BCCT transporter [Citreicella sp.]
MSDTTDDQGIPAPEGASQIIDTDYEIGQDNYEGKFGPFGLDIHNPVFLISGIAVVLFVFYTLALPEQSGAAFNWMFAFATKTFDWFFLAAANVFVIFCLVLIVSPLGKVRLGGAEASPDYSYLGWFAMLFAAGMGIGLMFFGVLEPVYHMAVSEPLGVPSPFAEDGSLIPENVAAAKTMGLAATIFHWGLHPWA